MTLDSTDHAPAGTLGLKYKTPTSGTALKSKRSQFQFDSTKPKDRPAWSLHRQTQTLYPVEPSSHSLRAVSSFQEHSG